MKLLHRSFALLLSLMLTAMLLAGCAPKSPADATVAEVAGMKGPTSLGLLKMMDDSDRLKASDEDAPYNFAIYTAADEITPKLVRGELDIAALPANLAAVLYQNTNGALSVLAVNTLGVLYLTELGTGISRWSDLKGQTVYATGKGSTPEYTLRFLLQQNGLDPDSDLTLEFKSEPAEIIATLKMKGEGIAMLPQPFATVAATKLDGLRTVMDLTAEWKKVQPDSELVTGVLVARTEFVEAHPAVIEAFLKEYKASVEFTNTRLAEAAALAERYGIVEAAIAEKAIPACNLVCLDGAEMKAALSGYLTALFEQNPKSVGGKLPENSFYYNAK